MNLPNYLSIARILAIPALVAMMLADFRGHEIIALVIYIFATLTDAIDGWLARPQASGALSSALPT